MNAMYWTRDLGFNSKMSYDGALSLNNITISLDVHAMSSIIAKVGAIDSVDPIEYFNREREGGKCPRLYYHGNGPGRRL